MTSAPTIGTIEISATLVIAGDLKLSLNARALIEDLANEKFVSAVSLWETAIKYSLGKLDLFDDFDVLFPKQI